MGKICDPPPFSGGQCRSRYQLSFTVQNSVFGSGTESGYTTQWGAISNFRIIKKPNGLVDVAFDSFSLGAIPLIPITERVTVSGLKGIWDLGGGRETTIKIANIVLVRESGLPDDCGDPPPINCRCTPDSCRVDCVSAPDGFCCIDHSLTNRLLQTLQG